VSAATVRYVRLQLKYARQRDLKTTVLMMCSVVKIIVVKPLELYVGNREVREKTNKMQQLDVYYQHFLDMFRASLCPSSGEQDVCYCTWCAAAHVLFS